MTVSVGVYTRISEDVEGKGLGVRRQETDCRGLARLRGWKVAQVFTDNDVSAYKAKVIRPAFESLMEGLESGELGGVVVYDLDRFARKPVDLERAIHVFDSRKLVFATVQGELDLSSPDGRTMARVMVAFANKSSMDTSRRVTRKHLELARQGTTVGGNRPFGWKPDRKTLDPAESALLKQAAQDVLGGVGLHTICRRWTEQGVATVTGKPWRKTVLKQMLVSPRLAGYRVYRQEIARQENGSPVKGLFQPILDEDTWQALRTLLTDPNRDLSPTSNGKRKYLLSGLVRCGGCSGLMWGMANTKWNTFTYTCRPPSSSGCGKCAITGPATDDLIAELVIRYLSHKHVTPKQSAWTGQAELKRVTAQVAELMSAYNSGELTSDTVFPSVAKLETDAKRLRREQAEFMATQVTTKRRPTNVTKEWPQMDTDARRLVIQSVLEAVVIRPAGQKGGRYDPDRVSVAWR